MRLQLFVLLLFATALSVRADWTMQEAQMLTGLCAISYCPQGDISAWSCPACSSSLAVRGMLMSSTDVRVLILDNRQDTTYVIFKGTDPLSWTEWVTDAEVLMKAQPEICGDCKVHDGFWSEHIAYRDAAYSNMQTSLAGLPSGRRVVVAGHSLGASTAALFALFLKQQKGIDCVVYTFGGPRIGNRAFADTYNSVVSSAYRFVHHKDIVPHLPPSLIGYYHEALLIYCPDSQGVNCNAMPGAEDDGGFLHVSVTDHGQYCGVNFFSYIDIGNQAACRA